MISPIPPSKANVLVLNAVSGVAPKSHFPTKIETMNGGANQAVKINFSFVTIPCEMNAVIVISAVTTKNTTMLARDTRVGELPER